MSGRQMSQTAKYQGAKCLGREMSLPPIIWGTYCPGSQISGRQMSQRPLSGADRRAPNVRQPPNTFANLATKTTLPNLGYLSLSLAT